MTNDITYQWDDSAYIGMQNYIEKNSDMQIHDHDYLTVSLLLSGSLIEHTNEGTQIVKAGDVLIKPPALMHSNIFPENCSILSFKLFDTKYFNFTWEDWEVIQKPGLLKEFLKVIANDKRKDSLSELKYALKAAMKKRQEDQHAPEKIKIVKHLLELHFLETVRITDLAHEVNLNPVYLGQAFKKFYGTDIKSYQQRLRLHYTVSKMFNQSDKLTQIAYSSGYADQSHFSREFKKQTLFSPKQFSSLLNL